MVRTRVILQGAEAVRDILHRIGVDAPEGAGAAMEITGAVVFAQTQQQVPVGATGQLKAGGYLTHATRQGLDWVVVIGYRATQGDAGTGYTRIQHYAKRFRHRHGHRLFLSGPAHAARGKLVTEVERQMVKRVRAYPRAS